MAAANEGTRQFDDIKVRRENGVQTIELNRPERLNALTYPMLKEITAAASLAAGDPSVRVVVLRGAGRSFCAGDSLKGMGELPESVDALQRFDEYGYFSPIRALRELSKPVIAAVHGHALGAGCDSPWPRTSASCTWKHRSGFRSFAWRSPAGPTSCPGSWA